jgi:anti-anti-sigma factor
MSVVAGKLLVWVGDQTACVRITGRANFVLSVDFRKLLRHLQASGARRLLLDLSDCLAMDSTFLGVLVHEANHSGAGGAANGAARMELLNAKASVREIFEDLGIARLFEFVERELGGQPFEVAPAVAPADKRELTRTCLEAHELLMALNPANAAKFKDVARFLAEELKKS